jgi:hypothetical protein
MKGKRSKKTIVQLEFEPYQVFKLLQSRRRLMIHTGVSLENYGGKQQRNACLGQAGQITHIFL